MSQQSLPGCLDCGMMRHAGSYEISSCLLLVRWVSLAEEALLCLTSATLAATSECGLFFEVRKMSPVQKRRRAGFTEIQALLGL